MKVKTKSEKLQCKVQNGIAASAFGLLAMTRSSYFSREARISAPPESRRSFAMFSASFSASEAGPVIWRLMKLVPSTFEINAVISILPPAIFAKAPTGA